MTGATSTSADGGGVDARTLLLLQPSEVDNNAAPMNPAKIFFFIVRFLAIEPLARLSHGAGKWPLSAFSLSGWDGPADIVPLVSICFLSVDAT